VGLVCIISVGRRERKGFVQDVYQVAAQENSASYYAEDNSESMKNSEHIADSSALGP
jgi:hypothetical protein